MLLSSTIEYMLKPPKCVTSSLRHQSFPITFLLLIVCSSKYLSRGPRTWTNSIPLARMKSIFWYMFGFLLVSFLSLYFPLTLNGSQNQPFPYNSYKDVFICRELGFRLDIYKQISLTTSSLGCHLMNKLRVQVVYI